MRIARFHTAEVLVVIEYLSATLLQLPSLSELELGLSWDSDPVEATQKQPFPRIGLHFVLHLGNSLACIDFDFTVGK